MEQNPSPLEGDLVIRKAEYGRPFAAGVVIRTELQEYIDPPYSTYQVYVAWCTVAPRDYSPTYGYSSANLRDLTSKYRIIKA